MATELEELQPRADEFHFLLGKYSKQDDDVADFLRRIAPWIEKIRRGEVIPPCYDYKLYLYFVNPDLSSLAERYVFRDPKHELNVAAGRFAAVIRDWYIDAPAK